MSENILVKFLRKEKYGVCFSLGGLVIASLLAMPIPYINGYIIDKVFIQNYRFGLFVKLVIVIACLLVVRYILFIVCESFFSKLNARCIHFVRVSIINKSMRLPLSYYDKHKEGYISARINESDDIARVFTPSIIALFTGMIDVIISFVILIKINISLAILTQVLFGLYLVATRKFARRIESSVKRVNESNAKTYNNISITVSNVKNIKISNDYLRSSAKLSDEIVKHTKKVFSQIINMIFYIETTSFFTAISGLLILFGCGIAILRQDMTIGEYSALAGYTGKIFSNIRNFANMDIVIKPIKASLERTNKFLDLQEEIIGEGEIENKINSIRIEKLGFSYSNDMKQAVFDDITFNLNKGDFVVVEGKNGAGKTTLVDLLLGLREPTIGDIYYNDISISLIDKYQLRSKVAVVCQNGYFIEGSLLENLLVFSPEKSMRELEKRIGKADLELLLGRFKDGINSRVESRGDNLSAGQKQILLFLRAIIEEKEILILDEPVSNMDIELKKDVYNLLKNNDLANFIILISHDNAFEHIEKKIYMNMRKRG